MQLEGVSHIDANDIDPKSVQAIQRNIAHNGLTASNKVRTTQARGLHMRLLYMLGGKTQHYALRLEPCRRNLLAHRLCIFTIACLRDLQKSEIRCQNWILH